MAIGVFMSSSSVMAGGQSEAVYRLYKEMGLQLRNKVPKRRVKAKLRADRTEASHSNDVCAEGHPEPDRVG